MKEVTVGGFGAQIGAGLATAAIAGKAKAHPLLIAAAGIAGAIVAHRIVTRINETCPTCGELLLVASAFV